MTIPPDIPNPVQLSVAELRALFDSMEEHLLKQRITDFGALAEFVSRFPAEDQQRILAPIMKPEPSWFIDFGDSDDGEFAQLYRRARGEQVWKVESQLLDRGIHPLRFARWLATAPAEDQATKLQIATGKLPGHLDATPGTRDEQLLKASSMTEDETKAYQTYRKLQSEGRVGPHLAARLTDTLTIAGPQ